MAIRKSRSSDNGDRLALVLGYYYRIYSQKYSIPFLPTELTRKGSCEYGECKYRQDCCALPKKVFQTCFSFLDIRESEKKWKEAGSSSKCGRIPWFRRNRLEANNNDSGYNPPPLTDKRVILCEIYVIILLAIDGCECLDRTREFTYIAGVFRNIANDKIDDEEKRILRYLLGKLQPGSSDPQWLCTLSQACLLFLSDFDRRNGYCQSLEDIFKSKKREAFDEDFETEC